MRVVQFVKIQQIVKYLGFFFLRIVFGLGRFYLDIVVSLFAESHKAVLKPGKKKSYHYFEVDNQPKL